MSHQPLKIHAGTQIVTKVGVHGSNNCLVHPRGAVGIATHTPCGHEQHFLVRFPDGFESSLLRNELDVLKLFKDRLEPVGTRDFALEDHVIYRCIEGSRAYGLETDNSDTDLCGIYLARWNFTGRCMVRRSSSRTTPRKVAVGNCKSFSSWPSKPIQTFWSASTHPSWRRSRSSASKS